MASFLLLQLWFVFSLLACGSIYVYGFDNSRSDNVAVYWGQNSYGAAGGDKSNYQQQIGFYCSDDSIDALPVAFVDVFFGTGGQPELDLANTCSSTSNPVFEGTQLPNCSFLAPDIQTCQSAGKIVTISLGGATGSDAFSSQSQATGFADTIWNLFLGGSSSTRPFGDAVLDGVDLDIEGGSTQFYSDFVNQLRSHMNGADKQYYITGAPQCPFPDAYLGSVVNAVGFDALYVQFYNNFCGVNSFSNENAWDFGTWDNWAKQTSPNKDIKIYIGAPASSTAAGSGYVDASTLGQIATSTRQNYSSFGGIMLWDASQAYANDNYAAAIKNAIKDNGGSPPSPPASSTPPTSSTPVSSATSASASTSSSLGLSSSSDSTTSTVLSSASSMPAVSSATSTPLTSSDSVTLSSTASLTASSSVPSASSSGPTDCSAAQQWSSSVAYIAGNQTIYQGHLWTAQWWSFTDVPGGAGGEWTDNGECLNVPTPTSSATSSTSAADPQSDPSADADAPPSRRMSRFFRF